MYVWRLVMSVISVMKVVGGLAAPRMGARALHVTALLLACHAQVVWRSGAAAELLVCVCVCVCVCVQCFMGTR